jgi:hypothetical protein
LAPMAPPRARNPTAASLPNTWNAKGGLPRPKMVVALVVLLGVASLTRADEWAATARLNKSCVFVFKCQSISAGVVHSSTTLVSFKEGTKETDCLLADLGELRDLKLLFLRGTDVTDDGLRRLEALHDLQFLRLENCPNITDEGVARLQKALPKCKILR